MIGTTLDGRYHITQPLGVGGQGQTYLAEDLRLYNAKRVVKRFHPAATNPATLEIARRLFASEVKVLSRLGEHDQIPQLFDHFEENHEFYLVQSFVHGHPLSQELPRGRKYTEVATIQLLKDILQPLAFVHQNQVIHRDIKPPNLIRRVLDNKLVLIDFGAVKEIRTHVVDEQGQTQRTVAVGSDGYMPSEQSIGAPMLSSDVYAVGIIVIQALTGRIPSELTRDLNLEICWRNQASVTPQFAQMLDKMVRYDCRQRYRSAVEVLQAIEQLELFNASGYTPTVIPSRPPDQTVDPMQANVISPSIQSIGSSTPPEFPPSSQRKKRTKRWLVGASLAALVLGMVGTGFYAMTFVNRDKSVSQKTAVNQPEKTDSQKTDQSQVKTGPELPQIDYKIKYKEASDNIDTPGHQKTFDDLYIAAEQAIDSDQASVMLEQLKKDSKGPFRRLSIGHSEWQVLVDSLTQSKKGSYTLTYERAKLNIPSTIEHQREFNLLFSAARKAISKSNTSEMLDRLKQDEGNRFREISYGHSEWQKLMDALQNKDVTLLDT